MDGEELIQALSKPRVAALVADLLREYEDGSALPHHFAKHMLDEIGRALVEDSDKASWTGVEKSPALPVDARKLE